MTLKHRTLAVNHHAEDQRKENKLIAKTGFNGKVPHFETLTIDSLSKSFKRSFQLLLFNVFKLNISLDENDSLINLENNQHSMNDENNL